jgi:RNA polymerase primary sigma factor
MAIGAIEATLRLGWKVVVLVHTKELQIQWLKVLRKNLLVTLDIKYRIGLLGNDHDDSLNNHDILIAIAASASKYYLLADDMEGLVVVDECHHYGSDSWKLCLEENFAARLGLTATYERDDNKMEELDDYFGGIVYQLDFEEASRDNVIAPFKIAFVGVNFEKDEQIAYDIEDSICKKLRRKLIDEFKLEPEPFSEFMKEVNLLADSGYNYGAITAGKYRAAHNRRKDMVAMAKQKPYALKLLKAAIKESQGTILFTQTIDSARTAAKKVDSMGISAIAIDSELKAPERKEVLEAYQRKKYKLIAAPKILDEGIDVPDSDLAIVSAASRSKRQMIQRMGRVLRKKNDNRMARVVIIYVKNTSEDPALGAHETFIDMVVDAAEEIRYFDIYGIATPLCDYLNDWRVF